MTVDIQIGLHAIPEREQLSESQLYVCRISSDPDQTLFPVFISDKSNDLLARYMSERLKAIEQQKGQLKPDDLEITERVLKGQVLGVVDIEFVNGQIIDIKGKEFPSKFEGDWWHFVSDTQEVALMYYNSPEDYRILREAVYVLDRNTYNAGKWSAYISKAVGDREDLDEILKSLKYHYLNN